MIRVSISFLILGLALSACSLPPEIDPSDCRLDLDVTTRADIQPNNAVCTPGQECSLRSAINTANICPGTQRINLRQGTIYPIAQLHNATTADPAELALRGRTALPPIRSLVVIEGNGAIVSNSSILARHFHVTSEGLLYLHRITLRDGTIGRPGEAFQAEPNGEENELRYQGGSILNEGLLNAGATRFVNNRALRGGAIASQGDMNVEGGSEFVDNLAFFGGGIFHSGRRATMDRGRMAGNRGISIQTVAGVADILNTGTFVLTFSHIRDGVGAVSVSSFGSLSVIRSTISGDDYAWAGVRTAGTAAFVASTLSLGGDAAVADCGDSLGVADRLSFTDVTAVAKSPFRDIDGGACSVAFSGSALAVDPGEICVATNRYFETARSATTATGCGMAREGLADLRLAPLRDNGGRTPTRAPFSGSPLVDASNGCLREDQRGVLRPRGVSCDVGAVEVR